MIFLTIFLSFFLSITLAQQIGPIVPTNRNFYGPPYQTMGGGYSGMHYPIQPINAPQQPWPPSSGYGAHDFMPYRPNTIQGVPSFNPYPGTLGMSAGGMDAISPINSYSNQMPIESSPALPNRNSVMAPIQVVYGKSVGMETQNEATTPSSSLPLFLQGASEDVIDEYKRIIRKPNSNYDEQVKEINQLVLRLDANKQKLYREFMDENDAREQHHRDLIHKKIGDMSEKAQEQFAKISALLRNQALPNEERWARVLSLYGKMDTNLRNEFEEKFKDFGSSDQV